MEVGENGQDRSPALLEMEGNRDIFRMMPVDSMHNSFLGNARYLIKRLFDDSAKGTALKTAANEIIKNIRPPNFIQRGPRTFDEMKHWKAHEYGNFLFYFSTPIFDELLDRSLITIEEKLHWTLFIEGISLINGREISKSQIRSSKIKLTEYQANMPYVHGAGFCTYNLHATTHMPEFVEELGPLWATSMFSFESFNSTIINSCNGTQNIPKQIAERLSWKRPLLVLQQRIQEQYPGSLSLYSALFRNICPKVDLKLQKISAQTVRPSDAESISESFGPGKRNLTAYDSVVYKGVQLTTWAHDFARDKLTNKCNCYVYHQTYQIYGQIERLIVENGKKVFVIFRSIKGDVSGLDYCIKNCRVTTEKIIESLIDCCFIKCVRVVGNQGIYIMRRINDCSGS